MSWPSGTFTQEILFLISNANSNQTQEISRIGEQNTVKEMVGLDLGKSSNNKQKKGRSEVWNNFEKYTDENGKDLAKCNICNKLFDGSSKMGTTHLKNHFNSCSKNKKNEGGGSASGDKPAENSNQTQEISHMGEQNVVKETVGFDLGKSSNKKQKKLRSVVWNNFEKYKDKNGKDQAKCYHCEKVFDGSSNNGTTHLWNHYRSCQNKRNEGGGSASGDKPAENSNQTQEISHMGEQNVVKETVGFELGKSSNKKQKKLRSVVWNNFEKYIDENGKDQAKCYHCEKVFDGSSNNGTTHLWNHYRSCQNKSNEGGGSASGDKPAENSNQTQEISWIREQNVVNEMVGLDLDKSSNKKQKILRSAVWKNFEKYKDENGKDLAKCNICEKLFDGSSKMGTTRLRNHFKSCSQNKSNEAENSVMGQQLNFWEQLRASEELFVEEEMDLGFTMLFN